MTALLPRVVIDAPNVYRWGFVADEPCHVRCVAEYAGDGWKAFVDWMVRPDGLVRPSGWVRAHKLALCPLCEGSGMVPSSSGLTDTACIACES